MPKSESKFNRRSVAHHSNVSWHFFSNKELQYYGIERVFMTNEEANFSKYLMEYRHIHFRQGFPVALTKYANLIDKTLVLYNFKSPSSFKNCNKIVS